MTLWFVDASVLLASEDGDDTHHDDTRRVLTCTEPVATLDLAYYEVANVAVRAWRDLPTARRLADRIRAIADDGRIVRADGPSLSAATAIAGEHEISVYDAGYAAVARAAGGVLVSCDVRDLVSCGLACLPEHAVEI